MTRYVAFLRAINVGGRTVTMERLRAVFTSLRLQKVETFIASGNVVFETASDDGAALAARIERSLQKALGYEVATFLRTDREVAEVAQQTPFAPALHATATAFCVGFIHTPLSPAERKALSALATNVDAFHANGREVYWLCQAKQRESDFSNALFERKVRAPVTIRSMTTLVRLAAKYPPASATPPRRARSQ